ncbi:hypothetical protein GGX14DRAFT_667356 [Mycena pura]|uniref:Uncharacterized protein n=1 Tax=Mycena pura TaxID=153505 RepID=A0AAD6Y3Y0_9AGAR|nr:hypothetical protein GGX14DRAFT_667356 [Mycena pura]
MLTTSHGPSRTRWRGRSIQTGALLGGVNNHTFYFIFIHVPELHYSPAHPIPVEFPPAFQAKRQTKREGVLSDVTNRSCALRRRGDERVQLAPNSVVHAWFRARNWIRNWGDASCTRVLLMRKELKRKHEKCARSCSEPRARFLKAAQIIRVVDGDSARPGAEHAKEQHDVRDGARASAAHSSSAVHAPVIFRRAQAVKTGMYGRLDR